MKSLFMLLSLLVVSIVSYSQSRTVSYWNNTYGSRRLSYNIYESPINPDPNTKVVYTSVGQSPSDPLVAETRVGVWIQYLDGTDDFNQTVISNSDLAEIRVPYDPLHPERYYKINYFFEVSFVGGGYESYEIEETY